MKIAHVTEAWNGGIATYVNTLILHQSGEHEIILIHSENETQHDFDKSFYKQKNIQTISYTSSRNPLKISGTTKTVQNILKGVQPDIVHLHSTFPGVYGRLVAIGFPVIYCPHGWSFVQESGLFKRNLYAGIEKILAQRTNAIIHVSRHEQEEAEKRNIKSAVNATIINGVTDVKKNIDRPVISVDLDKINIGFIGRLDHKKGFDIAARVFTGLPKNIELHVLGEASRDGQQNWPDAPNIHYHGWVDHSDIDACIQLFDAVLAPSRQEGFGLTVIETMRNSKPAIVNNKDALTEIVDDQKNGFVFKDEKHLQDILKNLSKKTLKAMGEEARRTYEQKYTDERFTREVMDLYERVLYTSKTAA